jgi:TolB protein
MRPLSRGFSRPTLRATPLGVGRSLRLLAGGALLVLLELIGTAPLAAQQNVVELEVQQDSLVLKVGQRAGLSVQAFDDKGNVVLAVKYRSSDEGVIRVAPNGTVTGVQSGVATVVVQAGRKSKNVKVTVIGSAPPDSAKRTAPAEAAAAPRGPPVASLSIIPASIYLLPAENLRVFARGTGADGASVGAVKVTWKSLLPDVVGLVDSTGMIVGVSPGQGVLAASAPGGATATVPVVVALTEYAFTVNQLVLAPERSETLHVVVPAQQNRELRNSDLQWKSNDPDIIRIGPNGVATSVAPGKTEIVASGFLQERHLPVIVHRPISTFFLTPDPGVPVQVPLLATRTFTVRAEGADSTPVADVVYDWSIGDTAVASFDAATLTLRAKQVGNTTLSFVVKGFKPVGWAIRVVAGSVGLSPSRFSLSPGANKKIAATLSDSAGRTIGPASDVKWTSSAPTVATVADDGTVQAVGLGAANITATVPGGKTASAQVFVVGDLLVSSTRRTGRLGLYHLLKGAPGDWHPLIVDGATNMQGVFSPDRQEIAFSSERGEPGNLDIYVADASGQDVHRLTTEAGPDNGVAWAPDAKELVFGSMRSKTNQLYVINVDGSGVRPLTSSPGGNWDPTISPDGAKVAFTSRRDGNDEIYLGDLAGGPQTNLTQTKDRNETFPHFLPTGDLLFLVERIDGSPRFQIVRMTLATRAITAVITSDNPITTLGVSRDGESVAYVTSRVTDKSTGAREFSLFLQPLTGGSPVLVPLQPGERIASVEF